MKETENRLMEWAIYEAESKYPEISVLIEADEYHLSVESIRKIIYCK